MDKIPYFTTAAASSGRGGRDEGAGRGVWGADVAGVRRGLWSKDQLESHFLICLKAMDLPNNRLAFQ